MVDLEEIRKRVEKATPGPWYASNDEDAYLHPKNYIMRDVFYDENSQRATTYRLGMWTYPGTLPGTVGAQERRATADFIAHARTDIPALLAALEWHTDTPPLIDGIQVITATLIGTKWLYCVVSYRADKNWWEDGEGLHDKAGVHPSPWKPITPPALNTQEPKDA